jgi:hypothetical protein
MIRIVWRFDPQVPMAELQGPQPIAVQKLSFPPALSERASPVFRGPRAQLQAEMDAMPGFLENPVNDLVRYYQVYVEAEGLAIPALERLDDNKRKGSVATFDLQEDIGPHRLGTEDVGGDVVTSCQPDTNASAPSRPWDHCQRYLEAVRARFAWRIEGGRGNGIHLADVERGWNIHHEDLEDQICAQFGPIRDHCHGTAVLGIIGGDGSNDIGVIGIAPAICLGLSPFEIADDGDLPNPEEAIRRTLGWLRRGDALLIEVQALRPGLQIQGCSDRYLPMEAWEHGQAAINLAHERGIYVIEAAANGGVDLDSVPGMPASGPALLVGAGRPATGIAVRCSNRGRRVDLQGWGKQVVTAGSADCSGHRDLQFRNDTNRCYMQSFDGTSSAAAIVAGCVAVVSGVVRAHRPTPLSPERMKQLLQQTGSFPGRAANGGIGPLPNLQAALRELDRQFSAEDPNFEGFRPAQ